MITAKPAFFYFGIAWLVIHRSGRVRAQWHRFWLDLLGHLHEERSVGMPSVDTGRGSQAATSRVQLVTRDCSLKGLDT